MDVGPAHHWPQENIFWISSKMIHQIWWTIALKNLTSCLVFENKLNKNASVAADKSKTHFPSTATWLRFGLCVCVFTKTIVSRPRRKLALFGLHLEHETGLVSQRELKRETGWSRFWFWFHLRECLFYPCTRANLSSGWTGAKRHVETDSDPQCISPSSVNPPPLAGLDSISLCNYGRTQKISAEPNPHVQSEVTSVKCVYKPANDSTVIFCNTGC